MCVAVMIFCGAGSAQTRDLAEVIPVFEWDDPRGSELFNDLFHRHLRFDERSVGRDHGDPIPGVSTALLWKNWDAKQYVWFAADQDPLPGHPLNVLRGHLLNGIPIDRFGYVWSAGSGPEPPHTGPNVYFGQGWPFPSYPNSGGKSCGWEWNKDGEIEGWIVKGGRITGIKGGLLTITADGGPLQIISPEFEADSFHAPFIRTDLGVSSLDKRPYSGDLRLTWRTGEDSGGIPKRSVSIREFATVPVESFRHGARTKINLPMYLDSGWNGQNIEQVALETILKPSDTVALNYLRLDYDTRQQVNNAILINASMRYYLWTGDIDFLQNVVPRMRQASLFMLYHLGLRRRGFIDASWLAGHDALPGPGHGIGGSYWDILATGHHDLYATTMAYEACLSMARLEAILSSQSELAGQPVSVDGQLGPGRITYAETESTWRETAEQVRKTAQTVFWNAEKQRFAACIDAEGKPVDYGFVFVNLAAVRSGIATQEQAEAVYDWLDGRRTVDGDTSQGSDIYAWRFAPRATTKRDLEFYVWAWLPSAPKYEFGDQVQDGGAVLYLSFDDLMNRITFRGPDDACRRLMEILDWHKEVRDFGGKGAEFYRLYYADRPGKLQGGGPPGGLGLDREFVESLLMPTAFLYGFMGVDALEDGILDVRPQLPKTWDYATVRGARYHGVPFDLTVRHDGFLLQAHQSRPSNELIRVYLQRPEYEFAVQAGESVISWIPADDDAICIQLPFESVDVRIVKKETRNASGGRN